MNELVIRYCRVKGIDPSTIINTNTDRATVLLRDAFIYLTWEGMKGQINHKTTKSAVLTKIAEGFNMRRNTIHEKVDKFEVGVQVYADYRSLIADIKSVLKESASEKLVAPNTNHAYLEL